MRFVPLIALLLAACDGPNVVPKTPAVDIPQTGFIAPDTAPTALIDPVTEPSALPEGSVQRVPWELESEHLKRLTTAGDKDECRVEMAKIRAELAHDASFGDADLVRYRDGRDIKPEPGGPPMPYPSPGTACAIFGIVRLIEGAVNDRRHARGQEPKYAEDNRPLVVGGE